MVKFLNQFGGIIFIILCIICFFIGFTQAKQILIFAGIFFLILATVLRRK